MFASKEDNPTTIRTNHKKRGRATSPPIRVRIHRKGFPPGKIVILLSALYEIKLNGLEYLLKQIRKYEQ